MLSVALFGFQMGHRSVRRGEVLDLDDPTTRKLRAKGLVRTEEDHPNPPTGTPSSASPAGQVLPQTTAKASRRGGRKSKAEPSSAPTQLFE